MTVGTACTIIRGEGGIMQKRRSSVFAIVGTVISAATTVVMVVLLALGLTA